MEMGQASHLLLAFRGHQEKPPNNLLLLTAGEHSCVPATEGEAALPAWTLTCP